MSPIRPTALVIGVWLDPEQTALTAVDLGHAFGRQLFR
jgi:hypothetical protein